MEILWKSAVSAEFQAIWPKLCGIYVFPKNFHTKKLGEIFVFCALNVSFLNLISRDLIHVIVCKNVT